MIPGIVHFLVTDDPFGRIGDVLIFRYPINNNKNQKKKKKSLVYCINDKKIKNKNDHLEAIP